MSPSQASETCASASSATSAWVMHYANGPGTCQETPSLRDSAAEITEFELTIHDNATDSSPIAITPSVGISVPETLAQRQWTEQLLSSLSVPKS